MTSAAGRVDRRRLGRGAGGGVCRVEVRRLGGELGGARVDHRVARPQAERQPRARGPLRRPPASPAISRSPNPARFAVASSVGRLAGRRRRRGARRPRGRPPRAATFRAISARNHGAIPVASRSSPPERRAGAARGAATGGCRTARGTGAARSAPRSAARGGSIRTPARSSIQRIGSSSASLRGPPRRRPRRGSRTPGPARVLGQRPGAGLLEPAERLVQRRAERPVDRHHLARRLHLASRASGRRSGTCRTGSAAA